MTDTTRERFMRIQSFIAKGGLVTRGRHRPAYGEVTLEALMDVYEERLQTRLGLRARTRDPRKVDAVARRGFISLWNRKGSTAVVKYPPVDLVLREAYPQHRPPQRHTDVVRFCDEGLLKPYAPVGTEVLEVRDPQPLLVTSYVYGRGECV